MKQLLPSADTGSIWLEIENRSSSNVLTRKYKKYDFFSAQRVFYPQERGLVTQGEAWKDLFRVKIFSIDDKMKTKCLLKLKVDKMYRVTVKDTGCSLQIIKTENVDKQLCAYQRMEEIWDNSNYYETLRISQDATQREIRVAYLKLAKIYHPDHNTHPQASLMFERVTEAYHTLSDEEIRQRYDTHLRTDPGVLSKSYWRQIFCCWNRHKAAQVGLSTLLCVTGSVILATSIFAAPSAAALPISVLGGAIGGGLFSAGIGGISIAMSRESALEDNKKYKRWMKFSFWYGIAGALTGTLTAGVGGFLGTAVGGGMAAVAASGAVNGGIQGTCFSVGAGIASERWIDLLKKLRVDAIALDLAVGVLTGAATGMIFQSLIMTTAATPSALMGHAKFSAEQLAGNNGGSIIPQKTEHPKRVKNQDENEEQKLLCFGGESLEKGNNNNEETTYNSSTFEVEPLVGEEEQTTSDSEILHSDFFESEDKEDSAGEEDELATAENFLPPEIEEFLSCEENTVESINEALSLYEEVAHQMPLNFLQFYSRVRATKIRMQVEYMLSEGDSNAFGIVTQIISPRRMFHLPASARFVQIYFEFSVVPMVWKPIVNDTGNTQTFAYGDPVTRRFFVSGYGENVHVSQIRDEYGQLAMD